MKRLTYIYCAAPLALALNNVPQLCGAWQWQLVCAAALAVGLWAVVWLRLYTNKRLRPEFSLLAVLPQSAFYGLRILQQVSPEAAEAFTASHDVGAVGGADGPTSLVLATSSPFWSNLYFFLWCGACVAGVCALLSAPNEEARPAKNAPLFLAMCILTVVFCLAAWAGTTQLLFPLSSS